PAGGAAVRLAADDRGAGDTGADGKEEEVRHATARAEDALRQATGADVVPEHDRDVQGGEVRGGDVAPSEVRRVHGRVLGHQPGYGQPDAGGDAVARGGQMADEVGDRG